MMYITKEHVEAERAYRTEKLSNSYRAATAKRSGGGRVRKAFATGLLISSLGVLGASVIPAQAAESGPPSWIEANWQTVEPTWEPNWQLLSELLSTDEDEVPPVEPINSIPGPK